MNEFKSSDALDEIFTLLRRTNKYIDETTPWLLAKDEDKKERLATVLYNLVESIRFAAVALIPFMPSTANKILDQLNTDQRDLLALNKFGLYQVGTKVVEKPEMLFARLDSKEIQKKVEELYSVKKSTKEKKEDNLITIEEFKKVELIVGTVEECKKHPDADKLLISKINIGKETRQIVSGIADYFTPEEFVGKKVIVVANLKPAKLRGIESQGMILAGDKKGIMEVVNIRDLPNGTKIH